MDMEAVSLLNVFFSKKLQKDIREPYSSNTSSFIREPYSSNTSSFIKLGKMTLSYYFFPEGEDYFDITLSMAFRGLN